MAATLRERLQKHPVHPQKPVGHGQRILEPRAEWWIAIAALWPAEAEFPRR